MTLMSKTSAWANQGRGPRYTAPVHFAQYSVFRIFYVSMVLGCLSTLVCGKDFFSNSNTRGCVCEGEYSEDTDYFPFKVAPDVSSLWTVEYRNSYKIVYDEVTNITSYLYLCGTPAPDVSDAVTQTQLVEIPIRRAGSDTTTSAFFFDYLNQRDSLRYYRSNQDFVTSECLQSQFASDVTVDNSTDGFKIETADIDLFFVSASNWKFAGQFGIDPRTTFTESGVPFISTSATSETDPLGKIEWTEFYSLFFNREQAALDVTEFVEDRYLCHADKVAALNVTKPKLAFLNLPVSDFFGPHNETCVALRDFSVSVRSCPNADCSVMQDAGAEVLDDAYVTANAASKKLSDVVALIKDAVDFIVLNNDWDTISTNCTDDIEALLSQTKAWANNNVFDTAGTLSPGRKGMDWFEGKEAEPDVMLLDFIALFHPTIAPDHTRRFVRRIIGPDAEESVITSADNCEDVNAPLFNEWTALPCANPGSPLAVVEGVGSVQPSDVCAFDQEDNAAPSRASASAAALALVAALVAA